MVYILTKIGHQNMKKIKSLTKYILGYILYNFLPKKKIVLILSSMRSGSTLLKALLGEAEDTCHINEFDFQKNQSKYITYFDIYRFTFLYPIAILKQPSNYDNFKSYPNYPNIPHKKIILVRSPLYTINSLINMNTVLKNHKTLSFLMEYWANTYINLFKYTEDSNSTEVHYHTLTHNPKKITQNLFSFIGSSQKNGTETYSAPKKGWKWGYDDGGDVIQLKKVVPNNVKVKNLKILNEIRTNKEILYICHLYNIKI